MRCAGRTREAGEASKRKWESGELELKVSHLHFHPVWPTHPPPSTHLLRITGSGDVEEAGYSCREQTRRGE